MVFSIHFYKFTVLGFPPLCPKPHKKEQIQTKTEAFMQDLQNNASKVKAIFKHEKLKYILKYDC